MPDIPPLSAMEWSQAASAALANKALLRAVEEVREESTEAALVEPPLGATWEAIASAERSRLHARITLSVIDDIKARLEGYRDNS